MPQITALKRQQRSPQRVNIFLDGKFAFALDLDTVLNNFLKVGKNLQPDEIQQLIYQGEYQKQTNAALKYVSIRPRSRKELQDWFTKRQIGEQLQPKIIEKLERLELLDDRKFAEWWIQQRQEFKKMGPARIRAELAQKGISRQIITELLNQSPTSSAALKSLATKKLASLQRYEPKQQQQKLTSFLLRRGYSYSQIKPIIDELLIKKYT